MIENLLADELRKLIANAVADYRLPVKNGEARPPQVVNGYLPLKRGSNDEDFPFVLVRVEGAKTEQDSTVVDVAIIVGCYAETFDGHEYCLNVMSRIRNALTFLPGWILAGKYALNFPIEYSILPDQPYPYWQLDMSTKWAVRTPEVIF